MYRMGLESNGIITVKRIEIASSAEYMPCFINVSDSLEVFIIYGFRGEEEAVIGTWLLIVIRCRV